MIMIIIAIIIRVVTIVVVALIPVPAMILVHAAMATGNGPGCLQLNPSTLALHSGVAISYRISATPEQPVRRYPCTRWGRCFHPVVPLTNRHCPRTAGRRQLANVGYAFSKVANMELVVEESRESSKRLEV